MSLHQQKGKKLRQYYTKKLTYFLRYKWFFFRLLEQLSEIKTKFQASNVAKCELFESQSMVDKEAKFIWLYLSTIGEMNAIKPFIDHLIDRVGQKRLVFITDHAHYTAPFLKAYPDISVFYTRGASKDVLFLAQQKKPCLFIIGEIPLALSDAPCRFPFAFLYYAKCQESPIMAVNGWLYRQQPSCLIDTIEHRLFKRDYFSLIDSYGVQNEDVKAYLISENVDDSRIYLMGNMKFDRLQLDEILSFNEGSWIPFIQASNKKCIVAGCVSELDEQAFVLSSFEKIRKINENVILVIAPRHPEFIDRMRVLENELNKRKLIYQKCSQGGAIDIENVQVIVLDTMGELRSYYAFSDVSYVGTDHNVLEPLAFSKPVIVRGGWHSGYPSYPVYKTMLDHGVIKECLTDDDFSIACLKLLNQSGDFLDGEDSIREIVASHKGATNIAMLELNESGWLGMIENA